MLINPNINPRYYYSTITPTLIRKMRGNRAKASIVAIQSAYSRNESLLTVGWADPFGEKRLAKRLVPSLRQMVVIQTRSSTDFSADFGSNSYALFTILAFSAGISFILI